MIQASEKELAFLILTFTEEGLGKLLGLRMLTLQLIAAQKNCVVLVSSVNTVSFGLDRFVTLRPLREKKNGCMKVKWLKNCKLLQKYINLGWSNRQKESMPDALNRNKKINSCWTQKTQVDAPRMFKATNQSCPHFTKLREIQVVRPDSALQKIAIRALTYCFLSSSSIIPQNN